MVPELRDLSYEECLYECGLTALETRRLRRDQIVFKTMNRSGCTDINICFFSLKKENGRDDRGHEATLVKDEC